jgi:arylsulfatase A-like enzyme
MLRGMRNRLLRGALLGVLLVAALALFWQLRGPHSAEDGPRVRRQPAARPDVILISIDTLRADHLGTYGYGPATSPFIDSLAQRGVVFESAFSNASWTLPSHMSLFTATYPRTHGVERNGTALGQGIPTLTEVLKQQGYATDGFVSWIYLKGMYGFARGFDHYRELLPPPELQDTGSHHSIRASGVVDEVLKWSNGVGEAPYFLFIHFFDPHINYEPPLEHARLFDPELDSTELGVYEHLRRYIKGTYETGEPPDISREELAKVTALYDGEIHFVDSQLKRLFDGLEQRGLLDNALVALTSDHGEELDEHGSMEGHQWTLYDEAIHVPLVVRFPGDRHAGERVGQVVQTIDLAPLLLGHLGIEAPEVWEGSDAGRLLQPTQPDAPAWPDLSLSHIQRFNVKAALRTPTRKLILTRAGTNSFGRKLSGTPELYDLEHDPGEQHDIYRADDPEAQSLMKRLTTLMAAPRRAGAPAKAPELSDAERKRLRALGYAE